MPMDNHLIHSLMRCGLFQQLSSDAMIQLIEKSNYKIFNISSNHYFMLADEECKSMNVVVDGRLQAYMPGRRGHRILMHKFECGDIIAPAFPYASDHRMPVSVKALESSTVLRIWIDDFTRLLSESDQLRMNFIRLLATMVMSLTQKINMLSLQTVREKIILYLRSEMKTQGGDVVRLSMTRDDMADLFGIQRYSLTRCLSELQAEGVIYVEGRKIKILDTKKLIV